MKVTVVGLIKIPLELKFSDKNKIKTYIVKEISQWIESNLDCIDYNIGSGKCTGLFTYYQLDKDKRQKFESELPEKYSSNEYNKIFIKYFPQYKNKIEQIPATRKPDNNNYSDDFQPLENVIDLVRKWQDKYVTSFKTVRTALEELKNETSGDMKHKFNEIIKKLNYVLDSIENKYSIYKHDFIDSNVYNITENSISIPDNINDYWATIIELII